MVFDGESSLFVFYIEIGFAIGDGYYVEMDRYYVEMDGYYVEVDGYYVEIDWYDGEAV